MQEGRGNEPASIARITSVDSSNVGITLTLDELHCVPRLINDALWKLRSDLDIEQFEFNRNHFAVKDRNLVAVLQTAGYELDGDEVARFEMKPLPAPTRSELIAAGKILGSLTHTALDDILLEAGIAGLAAGRNIGSRRDRANAITAFILANPDATTAENSLFSAFIARKASAEVITPANLDEVPNNAEGAIETRQEQPLPARTDQNPNRVFIVHGRNDTVRDSVVSFVTTLGLDAIVLHDQPNMGRHLLTKFVEEAELVTFAIVLMTDDDVGSARDEHLSPRARQNVILELGYFLSHLGQPRVCALITPGLETPSDFDGIVYIRMDEALRWQTELERELRAAQLPLR